MIFFRRDLIKSFIGLFGSIFFLGNKMKAKTKEEKKSKEVLMSGTNEKSIGLAMDFMSTTLLQPVPDLNPYISPF